MHHPETNARRLLGAAVAATLLWQPVHGQQAPVNTPPSASALDSAALDKVFARWGQADAPGCVVGVARAGTPPLLRAYGSADLEHDVPIHEDTVFEAGSVSKQITAASVLLLVQDGKLSLTDDVRHYLPELPDYGTRITIDQLLSHTSGLRDWGEVEALAGWPRTSRVYTPADVLAIAVRQRHLNYVPGTSYSYTNTGYNLLALIVERVSGQTLAEFSQAHLFTPVGMTHTSWRDDFRRVVKGRAVAYAKHEGGYEQLMPFEDAYGNGGLLTTVGDLLKWNDALTKGTLGDFVTRSLQQPAALKDGQPLGYARGLFVGTWHGTPEVSHSGSTAGYKAWLGRYPQAKLSIALLCNAADADSTALAHAVADQYLPLQVALSGGTNAGLGSGPTGLALHTPDAADPPTQEQLAEFEGSFVSDEALATWELEVRDGHLVATAADRHGLTLELKPAGPGTFTFNGPDIQGQLHFDRSSRGWISGLTMTSPRVYALSFLKVSPNKP